MSTQIQQVSDEIQQHLAEIADLFKPGAKLTLVMRSPGYPDGSRDMVVTDDEIPDVIAALRLRLTADERATLSAAPAREVMCEAWAVVVPGGNPLATAGSERLTVYATREAAERDAGGFDVRRVSIFPALAAPEVP